MAQLKVVIKVGNSEMLRRFVIYPVLILSTELPPTTHPAMTVLCPNNASD